VPAVPPPIYALLSTNPHPNKINSLTSLPINKPGVRRALAILVPAIIGTGVCWLCVDLANIYGIALFLGLPIVISFLASFIYCYKKEANFWATYGIACASITVQGVMILATAMDGLICLVMALPLSLFLGLIGTFLGRMAARASLGKGVTLLPLTLIFLFPGLVAFENAFPLPAPLRAVTTSVEIKAPIDRVWESVIAFPRIDAPPEGIFRAGIAYPIEARIDGHGVGAIRYCTFCTGSFVEPVTKWEKNRLLAFDVTSSPPPMKEVSIYEHVDAPHLHGKLESKKGQFRLEQRGNIVILEGTTWYRHEMWPQWYWAPMTDQIIHRIHQRVLDHIKTTSENSGSGHPN